VRTTKTSRPDIEGEGAGGKEEGTRMVSLAPLSCPPPPGRCRISECGSKVWRCGWNEGGRGGGHRLRHWEEEGEEEGKEEEEEGDT